MPKFELEWSMRGRAAVEADDGDEAEQILHEGLSGMDTTLFDGFDVDEVTTEDMDEVK